MNILKILLSYILPEKLETKQGNDNIKLNVYLDRGKIKIYTDNTNYSGGKLKTVFQKACKNIEFIDADNILVLGFGFGSLWDIIRNEKQSKAQITGVDYDHAIFELINQYRKDILDDKKTSLIKMNGQKFLEANSKKFDYIFIDLFIDAKVAPLVLTKLFWNQIHEASNSNSIIILNTMGISKDNLIEIVSPLGIYNQINIFQSNSIFYLKPIN